MELQSIPTPYRSRKTSLHTSVYFPIIACLSGCSTIYWVAYVTSQAGLKVLVWHGAFGADIPELRMPLPDYYPVSSTPYDQIEDVGACAMAEATVSLTPLAPLGRRTNPKVFCPHRRKRRYR